MDLQFKNKTAFISVSTAGIGYAIAESLLKEGVNVIINGRSQETIDTAIAQLDQVRSLIGKSLGRINPILT